MLNTIKYWIKILKLSRKRLKSTEDYVRFQRFQTIGLIKLLNKNRVSIKNKRILDVGCEYGGFAKFLSKAGAKVSAIDINKERVTEAEQTIKNVDFKVASVLDIPFNENEFDIIIASSLIEHILNQKKAVSEIHRVLKKQGCIYMSFPPFYSLNGGHRFKPFHLLPEKIAISIGKRLIPMIYPGAKKEDYAHVKSFKDRSFSRTTISGMLKMLKLEGFKNIKMHSKFIRWDFMCKIPILREFFVLHCQIIGTK